MDDLLPRTDISPQITSRLMTNMGSANWKEREKAIADVEEIVKAAAGRILPTVGDLFAGLKASIGLTVATVLISLSTYCLGISVCSLHDPNHLIFASKQVGLNVCLGVRSPCGSVTEGLETKSILYHAVKSCSSVPFYILRLTVWVVML